MRRSRAETVAVTLLMVALGAAACGTRDSTGRETTEAEADAAVRSQASASPPAAAAADGARLYAARCASCHASPDVIRAPRLEAMRGLSPAAVVFAMTNGVMRTQADGLSIPEMIGVAEHVAGVDQPFAPDPALYCEDRSIDVATRHVARWGLDDRASGTATAATIRAANVDSLRLKWAFGLPQTTDARSQPVITADTLFLASTGGGLFALDRLSGCLKWHRDGPASPRTSLTLGDVPSATGRRAALFFGDTEAMLNAVDATSGELIWRVDVAVSEFSLLTGATVQQGDSLFVPVSLYEVALAADDAFECCRAHGAVHRIAAATGAIIWTAHMTADAEPRRTSAAGTPRWGPSGVPVWSTPTVDAGRGLVYVGTGQNASDPATELSDSIVALDLESGAVAWHFQSIAGDVYNNGCSGFPSGANCPKRPGPDADFGASVVLSRTASGEEVLIAGQKSGDVFALDPDDGGRMLWHARVGAGSLLGGVHWGLAVSAGRIYAPVADPPFPIPGYLPRPGLVALEIDTGNEVWEHRIERGCEITFVAYLRRESLYPDCSFYYGMSAAATVSNDVVFAPSLDGLVRAFATDDGRELWRFATARPFATTNGVEAHGGAIDSAGVQVVGEMLYVQSGYGLFAQLPRNVLLAFELGHRR